MNENLLKRIVNATLYEGYMLYPYRPSAIKNRQRFNWGVLAPRSFAEANKTEKWQMQTECLIKGNEQTKLNISIRFLHLLSREIGELKNPVSNWNEANPHEVKLVQSLEIDGKIFQPWEEAVEREVKFENLEIKDLIAAAQKHEFSFPASEKPEPLKNKNGEIVGALIYRHKKISGEVEFQIAQTDAKSLYKITVQIFNTTPLEDFADKRREEILLSSFISTHTILNIEEGGEFVSLLETPDEYKTEAASCKNIGIFPVLVGENNERDSVLSSPIILYDYPQIAPESPGDLFDGGEIDEILTLRIMTLTDEEKSEMRGADDRTREILERTENLPPEQLMKLHGALRIKDEG